VNALVGILGLAGLFVIFGVFFRPRPDCGTCDVASGPSCTTCHAPHPVQEDRDER
jgi:hypothetical protein